MGDLSPHFSRREFLCRHCGRLDGHDPHLALLHGLEVLRAAGYAQRRNGLAIVSGYRCPERQAELKAAMPDRAALRSQHTERAAADVEAVMTLAAVKGLQVFSGIGVEYLGRGVLRRAYVVHVDVRHASGWNPTRGTVLAPTIWVYR